MHPIMIELLCVKCVARVSNDSIVFDKSSTQL